MITADTTLGQHWLHDSATLVHICDTAEVSATDTVLEIGPGLGTLTIELAKRAGHVVAVELDPALVTHLQTLDIPRTTIVASDIVQFDLATLPTGYKVIANVPYYITSKIVRLLLESPHPPSLAVLLVQKEVAERLAAQPGQMSLLSVSAQFYADVSLHQVVPARLFTPPPKVDSQVVRLDYRGPRFTDVTPKDFFRIVKAGFSERRKKLRSSLSGGLGLPKQRVDELLDTCKVSPDARAQELSLEDWHRLTLGLPA